MPTFRYPAIEYKQQQKSSSVFLFAAPCNEITDWAGIPRKEAKEGVQTVGFQRSPDRNRLGKLKRFLGQENNIIANSILCATRSSSRVSFQPSDPDSIDNYNDFSRLGWIVIEEPDYNSFTLLELLKCVENLILERLPRLALEVTIEASEVSIFCKNSEEVPTSEDYLDDSEDSDSSNILENMASDDENSDDDDSIEFSSESHIEEFFRAVRLRKMAIETTNLPDRDKFAGFSKDALKDYLHTATIVDGQHRLLGAQSQLKEHLNSEEIRKWQDNILESDPNINPDQLQELTINNFSRRIGITLINNDDWAEHVFQFVVVNQKAVKIPSALLGSIIATTLTDSEVERVTERLGQAEINVADYQTIALISGSTRSPFCGLVKRGYDEKEESEKKLDWSVLDRVVKIFRYLRGGKYFHNRNVDHAKNWRSKMLDRSKIVEDFMEKGFDSPYEYWQQPKGPWLDVFLAVWTQVRDQLSSGTDDPNEYNVWGYPKQSNLFNDLHLSILSADFFSYIVSGKGQTIDSAENAREIVSEWLYGAKSTYFSRDYGLKRSGIKKSEGPVKILWSKNWENYRSNGYQTLTSADKFRP